jgi:hypothetical protein
VERVSAAEARPRATPAVRLSARVRATPAWVWVGALFVLSIGVRVAYSLRYPAPWIFQDELVYSELAKSFAATGHLATRGSPAGRGFGVVYPVLISPAYAAFRDLPHAYEAAKVINAALMSLTAIPVYLIARRVAGPGLSLVAAALAVAIPSMFYTDAIMTENAFYPGFALWVLMLVRALERPTVGRQLASIGVLAVVYLTRPQGIVLVPILLTAVLLVVMADVRRDRLGLRAAGAALLRFRVTWLALLVVGTAYLVTEVVIRGQSLSNALLGNYFVLTKSNYSVKVVGRWFVYHLGEFDFSVGVLPFAAFLLVLGLALRRDAPRELTIFVGVTLASAFWFILQVAAFASTPYGQQIQERNVFYIAPLFLIALVAWIALGAPRPVPDTALAALAAGALPGVVPYDSLLSVRVYTNAFGLLPLLSLLERHTVASTQLSAAIVGGSILAAAFFIVVPRRLALLVPAAVLVFFALASASVEKRTARASRDSRTGAIQQRRDWIDRVVHSDSSVATLWTGNRNFVALWDNEFFNRSVGPVYNLYGPPDGLPQETVSIDRRTGALRGPAGKVVSAPYVLADDTTQFRGTPVTRDAKIGMTVYRTGGALRLSAQISGIYPDNWSGASVTYTRYSCSGGSVRVTLLSDPGLFPEPQTVAASSVAGTEVAKKTFTPTRNPVSFNVPLRASRGECDISFSVAPTVVPAQARPGNPDTRTLGVRFLRVDNRPPVR